MAVAELLRISKYETWWSASISSTRGMHTVAIAIHTVRTRGYIGSVVGARGGAQDDTAQLRKQRLQR